MSRGWVLHRKMSLMVESIRAKLKLNSLSDGEIIPSENKTDKKESDFGFGILFVDVDERESSLEQ